MLVPDDRAGLLALARHLIEVCGNDRGQRSAAYRSYAAWVERGQDRQGESDWTLALCNLLYSHVDRLASHLFSPTDMRFTVDFDLPEGKDWAARAAVVARLLSREWARHDSDIMFGLGVNQSLIYATTIAKLLPEWRNGQLEIDLGLVMPWDFGVYNPGRVHLNDQEAVIETVYMTKPEIRRRLQPLPDAGRLFDRIVASGASSTPTMPQNFMHQVLSTMALDSTRTIASPAVPGGLVQLAGGGTYPSLGPQIGAELYPMYEIYVRDDERGLDWTTIQFFEPDVIVAPLNRRVNIAMEAAAGPSEKRSKNLFVRHLLPYGKIQPNLVTNYFWGRSEIADLMQLQAWLTEHLGDIKTLMAKQIERIIGFEGYDGLPEEMFLKMRESGYFTSPGGTKITDMTPTMPPNALEIVELIIRLMDRVSGFSNILSGSGEPGVRAGVHADTLMRTASPRLRDRSLLIERQVAAVADAYLGCMEAKDPTVYWTDPENPLTDFHLSQLLTNRRVSVDSHSASPIYATDHAQLLTWGLQRNVVGPEDVIEDLPFSHKDQKLERLRQRQAARQKFIEEHPEVLSSRTAARRAGV